MAGRLTERSCHGWTTRFGGSALRRHLLRAGFEDDCRDCRSAVAHGHEACALHYVPVGEREPEREQGELFEASR